MDTILYIFIGLFGFASYLVGSQQIIQDKYKPSVFSRVIWLLLAINSFAGVIFSEGSAASVLLAAIFLLGNAIVCLLSFWKGTRIMRRLEWVCLVLLGVSAALWFVSDAPLVNLIIGLLAHFIGALPTYKRVWADGSSESTAFWSLFFVASLLSIILSQDEPFEKMLFPIYFTIFDGGMTLLSLRRQKNKSNLGVKKR